MSSQRAEHLLHCAVAYRESEPSGIPVPNTASSSSEMIEIMMNVLWYEAKESMQAMIETPEDPYLYTVDIDTGQPGIVTTRSNDILRRKTPMPRVHYEQRLPPPPVSMVAPPPLTHEQAMARAQAAMEKSIRRSEKKALKDIATENASIQKIEAREQKKRQRAEETPEEREERLQKLREKRADNKKKRDEEKNNRRDTDDTVLAVESKLASNCQLSGDTSPDEEDNVTNNVIESSSELPMPDTVVVNVVEALEDEASAEAAHHQVIPPRVKARQRRARFFASPVPIDRHLGALEVSWPNSLLESALLRGEPSPHLQVVQGPPGTGKTTKMIEKAREFCAQSPHSRVLLCAPTNVGVANLYKRAVKSGLQDVSLLLPPSRIPSDTPVMSQDPGASIVCTTVSGRSGHILDPQKFDAVFVDEAAQCIEAWTWGLIRPEVTHLVLVGDTNQLPALVSEKGRSLGFDRSLMQRLVELKYPADVLRVQRRMHPDIVSYPNKSFYSGILQTVYPLEKSFSVPYSLVECAGECTVVGTSCHNKAEALRCVQLATELRSHFSDVIIITPYQAQCREILSHASSIPVHTVDSFQGHEADAVVLSMVRVGDNVGFWSDERRLVVALTRAKHCMRVVGSVGSWTTGPLKRLADDFMARCG